MIAVLAGHYLLGAGHERTAVEEGLVGPLGGLLDAVQHDFLGLHGTLLQVHEQELAGDLGARHLRVPFLDHVLDELLRGSAAAREFADRRRLCFGRDLGVYRTNLNLKQLLSP